MGLKLQKDRNDDFRGQWFHVGVRGTGDDASFVGWSDEDEARESWLKEVPKEGRVKVAPLSTPEFRQYRAHLERKNRRFRTKDGSLPPNVDDRITFEALARTVLLDWEGIELSDGTDGAYTPAKGLQALTDSRAFDRLITGLSVDLMNARHEAIEEDAKHLGEGSSGKSSGPNTSSDSSE